MTAKKRWFSKITDYSAQEAVKSDTEISWTNSDSDADENLCHSKKKLKTNNDTLARKKSTRWVQINTPTPLTPSKCSLPTNAFDVEASQVNSSKDKSDFFRESPIISQSVDQSPVLTRALSPIIGSRNYIKQIKLRRCRLANKPKKSTQEIQDDSSHSPELFSTQSSRVIIETQTSSCKETPINISLVVSESSQSYHIDPFPSQHSSQIESTTSSSSSGSGLYHQPPPKRRRLKKGGLASQLQKALDLQRGRVAIWQHEIFLNKSNNESGLELQVKEKSLEYGCILLLCEKDGTDKPEPEALQILLLPGNVAANLFLNMGSFITLFRPYSTKLLLYEGRRVTCYFNAHRIINRFK